jgi:hypothetical protein
VTAGGETRDAPTSLAAGGLEKKSPTLKNFANVVRGLEQHQPSE